MSADSFYSKKEPGHTLEYLTVEGIKSVLDAVEASSRTGLRDLTILSLMYDSAARVQEIADLSVNDFRAEKPSTLRLTGKGSKTRIVPLMSTTSDLMSKYISIYHPSYRGEYNVPLFSNRKKEKLTRAGIAYILKNTLRLHEKNSLISFLKQYHRMVFATVKVCICCKQAYH